MSRFLVYATALFFLVYGAIFVAFPMEMAHWVTGASLNGNSTSAIIDFRATYGGAQLAIGVVLLLVMKLRADVDLALLIVAASLLLMALGRVIGIVVDTQPNTLMLLYLFAELVFGGLALWQRKQVTIQAPS